MQNERRQVLEMLAEGRISADDAERLLEKLSGRPSALPGGELPDASAATTTSRPPRYLRVVVHEGERDVVNIRVPLALVRTGVKLTSMLPALVAKELAEHGIDLSGLRGLEGEELVEALRELKVDLAADDGESVRVFCE